MCYEDIILVPLFDRADNVRAYALIDAADEDLIFAHYWHLGADDRACRIGTGDQGGQIIYMHRVVMGVGYGDDIIVDHINRQHLDNRRSNLRLVTTAQNSQNRSKKAPASSQYRGVSFRPADPKNREIRDRWVARVSVGGRMHNIGSFPTEEDAAQAAQEGRIRLMSHAID